MNSIHYDMVYPLNLSNWRRGRMSKGENFKLAIWSVIYLKELFAAFLDLLARVESDIEALPNFEVKEGKAAREVLRKIREAASV